MAKKKETTLVAYKGFDKNWQCRGFQYEVGKTYVHKGGVIRCASGGFHSCEYPLDVFGYYAPSDSQYAVVEVGGKIDRDDSDTKIASGEITVKFEINLPKFVTAAVDWINARIDRAIQQTVVSNSATNTGYRSAATNTGYQSAATNTGDGSAATNTGDGSAATNTGYQSAATNTGYRSAATNTGYQSAATNTGYQSAATNTGDQSAATNTGYRSAATNTGDRSAATNTGDGSAATNTGYQSAATNTGDQSAATNTGYRSAATVEGPRSVAIATGLYGKAKACAGSAIVLVNRDDEGNIRHIRASKVGENGIKPDVFYTLNYAGDFVEA